jgi:acyl dehydratase
MHAARALSDRILQACLLTSKSIESFAMTPQSASTRLFQHQAELTDALIEEARSLEGTPLRIEQWNQEATLDTIRHYAWGIGDDNPLFCDEDYAAGGRHRTIVAPPSFLHSVYSGDIGIGLAGLQPVHAGYHWKYFDWIRRGDRLRVDARVGPIKVLTGRYAERLLIQTTISDIYRGEDLVASLEGRTFRLPRAGERGGLSYEARPETTWTPEELEAIRIEAVTEPRRGATPRLWGDVSEGDELPKVVKGPIELLTMTSYYAGRAGSPGMKGVEMKWRYVTYAREDPSKLPTNYDLTFFDETVQPSLGHQVAAVAHEIGMPGAYANGGQRASWVSHAITNWMGDDGDLVELVGGTVVRKVEPDLVVIEMQSVNQFDEVTVTAEATVRLPAE